MRRYPDETYLLAYHGDERRRARFQAAVRSGNVPSGLRRWLREIYEERTLVGLLYEDLYESMDEYPKDERNLILRSIMSPE
jgi:hypothetical protein